jgi:molecular chaperone DnaJ
MGQGEVTSEETVRITLPVGVEDGMVLRVSGQGQASRTVSGVPGDLFVVIHIASDPRFERRGIDLWRTETITVVDSVLGTRVEVPTLDGPTMVTIPPGTQPETVLRLRDKGLPEFGGQAHGDLYLRIRVHIPSHLTGEERTLYERLRALQVATTETAPGRETPRPQQHVSWLTRLAHIFKRVLHR